MKLHSENCEVEIVVDTLYTRQSTDNVNSYGKEYIFGRPFDDRGQYGVVAITRERVRNSCMVIDERNSLLGFNADSALIALQNLFLVVENCVCSLSLPTLELLWHIYVDSVYC